MNVKKYIEVLKALKLSLKSISRVYTDNIPLGFKMENTRFKIKTQPKFTANETVYSDLRKLVRQKTFWDCTEILQNLLWGEIRFIPYHLMICCPNVQHGCMLTVVNERCQILHMPSIYNRSRESESLSTGISPLLRFIVSTIM